jgi:hypothetical protein
MALPTTSPAAAAAAAAPQKQNNRRLVNRPSNPIISMVMTQATNIIDSQQEGQLSDLANIVAAEYNNNNNHQQKKSENHVVATTALDSLQLLQEQTAIDEKTAIKSVEFAPAATATITKNSPTATTTAAAVAKSSSNNSDSNSNSDILTASLHRSKRGTGYLASQTDLTSISSEQFALGCTLLQLCAIGSLHDVITYI